MATLIILACVAGVAIVVGAGKLMYDASRANAAPPRPRRPWEELP